MNPMVFQWINFFILIGILIFFGRKGYNSFFANQRAELERKMQEAGMRFAEIKKQHDAVSAEIAALPQKIAELQAGSLKQIQFETQRLETETEDSIRKLSLDVENRLQAEVEKAKANIEKQLFEKALASARISLRSEFSKSDVSTPKNQEWIAQAIQPDIELPNGKKNYAS